MNKFTDKIIDFLKENKWTFIISAGIIIFFEPLKDLTDKLLVNPILSKIKATETLDVIFFIFSGITIIYWTHKALRRNYKVAVKHLLIYGFILTGYFLIREHSETPWRLLNLQNYADLYYLDIIFPICGLAILTGIIIPITNIIKESSQQSSDSDEIGFEIDEPLLSIKDIENKEWDTSKEIVTKILNTKLGKGAFVIGLNGEWGSGKSTYWNLMKERLRDEKDYIIIEFNPWNNECDTSITQNFLNKFKSEVSKYHSNITPEIEKYSKAISQTYKNGILKTLTGLTSKSHSPVEDELGKLKETILQLNKKIIIFIDDIDRLCNDEIYEVLKLVRNNANFPNTFFILAYDREYIEKSLSNLDIPKPTQYVEKIINYEHCIGNFKTELLNAYLKTKLKEALNLESDDKFESQYSPIEEKKSSLFSLISTMRDAKRLFSHASGKINILKNEMILYDLIFIEALRSKYPRIVNEIKKTKSAFLEWTNTNDLGKPEDTNNHREDSFLAQLKNFESIDKNQKSLIIHFIKDFVINYKLQRNYYYDGEKSFISIFNKLSFDKYINGEITTTDFSFEKFNEWRNLDDTSDKKVLSWTNDVLISNVLPGILISIQNYKSQNDFIKINRALLIFKAHEYKNNNDQENLENVIESISSNLTDTNNLLSLKLFNSKKEYQNSLCKILQPIKYPFQLEIKLSQYLLLRSSASSSQITNSITPDQYIDLTISYIERYLQVDNTFDDNFTRLFNDIVSFDMDDYNNKIINTLKSKIKNEYLPEYLKSLLITSLSGYHTINNGDKSLFSTLFKYNRKIDYFEKFLTQKNVENNYEEIQNTFLQFYKKLKENKFDQIKENLDAIFKACQIRQETNRNQKNRVIL